MSNVLAARAHEAKDAAREVEIRRDVALLMPPGAGGTLSWAAQTYLETRLRLRNSDGLADDLQTLGIAPSEPAVRLVMAALHSPSANPGVVPMAIRDVPGPIWETVDAMAIDEALPALDVCIAAANWDWSTPSRAGCFLN